MRDNWLKSVARRLLFPPGSIRRIRFGPLRGMVYRVGLDAGMSPWYSGGEREHQETFRRLVRPGDVVVDVGANWGLHTLYLSRLTGPDGLVIAVEPLPSALDDLGWHLKANRCENVRIVPVALSDGEGSSVFLSGKSSCTGTLAASARSAPEDRGLVVATRTLDAVVEEWGVRQLRLVKIDVEGAEGLVLRGAEKALTRYRPSLVIDLHTPEQDVAVARWLTERGYQLQRLSPPPILRTDVGWPESAGVWGSILATPTNGDGRR